MAGKFFKDLFFGKSVHASGGSVVVSGGNGGSISIVNGRVFIDGVERHPDGSARGGSFAQAQGPSVDRDVDVGEFTSVASDLPIAITWSPGPPQATLRAAQNLQGLIKVAVEGGALTISSKGSHSGEISVELSSSRLGSVELGGAARATLQGIQGESFEAKLAGSAELSASGSVMDFKAQADGASRLLGFGLAAQRASLDLSDSSSAEACFRSQGDLRLSDAAQCEARADGSLTLKCSDAAGFSHAAGVFSEAAIKASDASSVHVALGGSSTLKARDAARITFAKTEAASAPIADASMAASIKERALAPGQGAPIHGTQANGAGGEASAATTSPTQPASPVPPARPAAPNRARPRG